VVILDASGRVEQTFGLSTLARSAAVNVAMTTIVPYTVLAIPPPTPKKTCSAARLKAGLPPGVPFTAGGDQPRRDHDATVAVGGGSGS